MQEVETLQMTTNVENDFQETPLHKAAQAGSEACAKFLLQHGADPFAVDQNFRTALHVAAEKGHFSCLKEILKPIANGDEERQNGFNTQTVIQGPFHCIIDFFDCNNKGSKKSQEEIPLQNLSDDQPPPQSNALLSHFNVNVQDYNLETPLHLAAKNGHFECYELLKSVDGVDISLTNKEFKSAEELKKQFQTEEEKKKFSLDTSRCQCHKTFVLLH
jgi:ankyrin repeat protein